MTATLAMRRGLQRKLRVYAGLQTLAGSLQRMRAEVWRRTDDNDWRNLSMYRATSLRSFDGYGWRVRLELWQGKSEHGPANPPRPPEIQSRPADPKRVSRGRRYITALGEGEQLHNAVGMALVQLDEQIDNGWYAVKLEPSARVMANRMRRYGARNMTEGHLLDAASELFISFETNNDAPPAPTVVTGGLP